MRLLERNASRVVRTLRVPRPSTAGQQIPLNNLLSPYHETRTVLSRVQTNWQFNLLLYKLWRSYGRNRMRNSKVRVGGFGAWVGVKTATARGQITGVSDRSAHN